ncbi:MAG: hypothetical protein J5809_04245 [Selenomonadaceae bacterium]|nr:hypothetical protein [Selenomonadaceae bacterium]
MLNRIKKIKDIFGSTFKTTRLGGEFILRENDFGRVHLDTSVIQRVVEHTKVFGVHEIKNVVVDKPSPEVPLNIRLSLTVEHDLSLVEIGEKLRDEVKRELYQLFGINDATFDIRVVRITNEIPDKTRRRVR